MDWTDESVLNEKNVFKEMLIFNKMKEKERIEEIDIWKEE